MEAYRVTSEIHTENDNLAGQSTELGSYEKDAVSTKIFLLEQLHSNLYIITRYCRSHTFRDCFPRQYEISKFLFQYRRDLSEIEKNGFEYDSDGDFVIVQKMEGELIIEHSISTALDLVGLQVWRGAFLLADYILHNAKFFKGQTILELGSGVGLTSIIAGMFAKEVTCTDVNVGGILELIQRNVDRNKLYIESTFSIMELNFLDSNWSTNLQEKLNSTSIFLAADVIYDDQITDAFVRTVKKLLDSPLSKTIYITLEKRFVFTISDLDSVAPMYEEFLRCVERHKTNWNIQYLNIDFPEYFQYNRVEQLILLKIENRAVYRS